VVVELLAVLVELADVVVEVVEVVELVDVDEVLVVEVPPAPPDAEVELVPSKSNPPRMAVHPTVERVAINGRPSAVRERGNMAGEDSGTPAALATVPPPPEAPHP
jgi:hypothetical protein